MNYLSKLNTVTTNCPDCRIADSWCDKHKRISKKLSALSVKLQAYIRRNEDTDAIDEVIQQMEQIVNS